MATIAKGHNFWIQKLTVTIVMKQCVHCVQIQILNLPDCSISLREGIHQPLDLIKYAETHHIMVWSHLI